MTQIIDRTGFVPDTFTGALPQPLSNYTGAGALALSPDDNLCEISGHFSTLTLVVVPFARSADGRGFSVAAALRDLGYRRHLRASGHILVDQFRAILGCGFDDVEISDEQARRNPECQWQAVPLGTGYKTLITT